MAARQTANKSSFEGTTSEVIAVVVDTGGLRRPLRPGPGPVGGGPDPSVFGTGTGGAGVCTPVLGRRRSVSRRRGRSVGPGVTRTAERRPK